MLGVVNAGSGRMRKLIFGFREEFFLGRSSNRKKQVKEGKSVLRAEGSIYDEVFPWGEIFPSFWPRP